MLSVLVFGFLIVVTLVQIGPVTGDACQTSILESFQSCWGSVKSSRTCELSVINLSDTKYTPCSTVGLGWWSGATNNLIVNIETSFIPKGQPYAVHLNNMHLKQFKDDDIKIYRIINGQETQIISSDDVIILNSDANNQVILKFQGPKRFNLLPIIYEIIKV